MTLICLGLVKKKLYPRDFDDYTKNEMSIFFSRYSSDLYAHNQKELAEYFIEKSIKNNPKNVKALNIRGILKLEKGYFDQAVKDFSASIDFEKKNNGEAYYYRAMSKKSNNDRDGFIMDLYLAKDLGFQNAIEYFNQNKGLIEIRIIDYKDSSDQVDTLKIYNYMIYIANELLSNNRISDVEYKKFMLDINTTNATSAPLNWHKIVFKRIERRSSSEIISLIKDKFSGIITSEEYYIKEKLIILNYLSQTLKIDSHLDKNLYCNLSISQQDKVEMFLNSVVNSDVIFLHNNKIKILDFNSIQKNILGKENIKIIYQNYNAT
jgi:tetratricopeptide (TPR) repeat protein